MQDRIIGMKEEEYQSLFLNDLFVNVFGYTLKPQAGYNLEAEKKNPNSSKKADGAILNDLGDVHCVIELKGTDTIDLNRVEAQGFGYLNANPGCRYLITSNFARLRFYLGDTTAYLEWDLFNLNYDDFRSLWLCIERQSLLADRPMKVREESTVKEEEITKHLYRDYSAFKRELFSHLRQNHPDVSPLRLFQLTQKLLDRLLFVFFGEDKGLLPPNTASKPIGDFDKLREIDAGQPLYQLLIKYFNYIDTGTKRKDFEIPAYNGGLFAPDPELDALNIPDPILRKHLLKLTAYKFDSEVDVNILGHIFEHSLNEIEEVQAELRGEAVDKSKTKRKKDGVFYTPRYITKYIVENTVGRLCTEKRNELGIDEQDYARGKKRRKKATIIALRQNLETYRAWLLDLKICDPACGSGAFLNEALNFLIAEHENVSELERQLFDSALRFDPGPSILENNLYGVDINDEAVEIARLSLWLRTAQKGRKLTNLSGRIKVGNSLIDDPAVAGDKAFVWAEEFPEVFGEGSRGGFDVVVGNPPYVRSRENFSDTETQYYFSKYKTVAYQPDLYKVFMERGLSIIMKDGLLSYVVPSVYLTNDYDDKLRRFLLNEACLVSYTRSEEDIFADVSVNANVILLRNSIVAEDYLVSVLKRNQFSFEIEKHVRRSMYEYNAFVINEELSRESYSILEKMRIANPLGVNFTIHNGIKVRSDLLSESKLSDHHKPYIGGSEVSPMSVKWSGRYIDYDLSKEKLFTNQAFRKPEVFERNKVVVRQVMGERIFSCVDLQDFYADQSTYLVSAGVEVRELYSLQSTLSSKLLAYYFFNSMSDNKRTFPKIKRSQLLQLPILTSKHSGKHSSSIHELNAKLPSLTNSFLRLLQRNFPDLEKLSKKLQDWPSLDYAAFVKELNKALKKVKQPKLSLTQEVEWESVFEAKRAEVLAIRAEILTLDREIDVAVYKLYGLTWEEVLVVDDTTKEWMSEGEYESEQNEYTAVQNV